MLEEQLVTTLALLKAHPAAGIVAAGLIAALFFLRPKEMLKLVVFGLFLVAAYYFITLFTGTLDTGSHQKDRMIYKTREAIGDN